MMKPRLLHPLGEGRHSRRHRRRRGAAAIAEPAAIAVEPLGVPAAKLTPTPEAHAHHPDPDVQRVQEAGGPIDHASYSCACGYLFSADVSTSVICPHCGSDQAW
jgi:hypothetical protein